MMALEAILFLQGGGPVEDDGDGGRLCARAADAEQKTFAITRDRVTAFGAAAGARKTWDFEKRFGKLRPETLFPPPRRRTSSGYPDS